MKAVLIPVKEFREAKKRLAPHFSPDDRAALAQAMCEDFFGVVGAVRCADRIFVISKEPQVLLRARELGWETIAESRQISESDSVDAASRYCAERGEPLQIFPFVDVQLQTRVAKHVRAHAARLRLRQVTHEAVRTEVGREERGRRPQNRIGARAIARRNQNGGWTNPQGLKHRLDVCRFNQGNIYGQTEKGLHAQLGAITRSGIHRIALRNLA